MPKAMKGQRLVWPLAFLAFLAILILAVSLGVIGSRFASEMSFMNQEVVSLRNRLSDLEAENDYLFEGKEAMMTMSADDIILEKALLQQEQELPDFCLLQYDSGPCGSRVPRWFYDKESQDCQRFIWGGCRGNDNNFLSIQQCQSACQVDPLKIAAKTTTKRPMSGGRKDNLRPARYKAMRQNETFLMEEVCHLPPNAGPCNRRIPRFYHSSGNCLKFEYGGCAGNQNNFFTKQICESKCLVKQTSSSSNARICAEQLEIGTCQHEFKRFFFNSTSQSCEPFKYTGCGGNQNNFSKKSKCEKRCLKS